MFPLQKVILPSLKEPPSNFTLILAPLKKVIVEARLLFEVVGNLMHSSGNLLLALGVLKCLKAGFSIFNR